MSNPNAGFHPTVEFDGPYWVYDFTRPTQISWSAPTKYSVGRFDEHRPGMYTTELFQGKRDHHVGLDLGAPAGTAVHAFEEGTVYETGINDQDGSYGPTLITEHCLALPTKPGGDTYEGVNKFWVLYGHLNWESIKHHQSGDAFGKGALLATMGAEDENGGWPPHVHVQISTKKPLLCDMPGVVHQDKRDAALEQYLDPRLICGPLY